jgi:hypothetical protein
LTQIHPAPLPVAPEALLEAPPSRLLSDDAYAHADALVTRAPIRPVPPWAPEYRFLFDSSVDVTEARNRLHQLHTFVDPTGVGSPENALWNRFPLLNATSDRSRPHSHSP